MNKFIIPLVAVVLISLGIGVMVLFKSSQPSPTETIKTMEQSDNSAMKPTVVMMETSERYLPYSSDAYTNAQDKKRVLFFHAAWCPTCKSANEAFMKNTNDIPTDVVIFKTDYDTEKELKKTYAITYQHTFVYVDNQGKEIKKWSGGDIQALIDNVL